MDFGSAFDQLVKVEPIDSNEVAGLMAKVMASGERIQHTRALLTKVTQGTSQITARSQLHAYCRALESLSSTGDCNAASLTEVCETTLEVLQPRSLSFEDAVTDVKKTLSSVYQEQERWREAAQMLSSIQLESGQRNHDDKFKLDIYLRITQLQLEYDDSVAAEASLSRAAPLISALSEPGQKIIYKVFNLKNILINYNCKRLATREYSTVAAVTLTPRKSITR